VGVALFNAEIRKGMTKLIVAFRDYFVNTLKRHIEKIRV